MYVFLIACANGDVLLEQDGTPKILWGDAWSPICGHYFWDNQVGATKFCQKLGYGKGAQSGSGSGNHYTTDSFRLGSCQEGDELTGCTGGCNDYVVGGQCSNSGIFSSDECTQGDANAMTIHCIEPSNTVFNPSCTSKLTPTYALIYIHTQIYAVEEKVKFTYPLYYIFFQPTNSLENGQMKEDAMQLAMIRLVAQDLKNKLETVLMVYLTNVLMLI